MAYELKGIEAKLSADQLKKKLQLFHDNQAHDCKNLCYLADPNINMEQSLKAATYKIITNEFQEYFESELFRIRTALATHRIKDPEDKFIRYISTNYHGLLKLQDNDKYDKPLKFEFNSSRFKNAYEKVTLHQIHYDLQTLFVAPLTKTFEEEYQAELMSSSYLNTINKYLVDKPQTNSKLKWNGKVNKLVTILYDLTNNILEDGQPVLSGSTGDLIEFLVNNFTDKSGSDLSEATIRTILSPGKPDKRSPEHKKYKFPF